MRRTGWIVCDFLLRISICLEINTQLRLYYIFQRTWSINRPPPYSTNVGTICQYKKLTGIFDFYDDQYVTTLKHTSKKAWMCVLEPHTYTNTLFSDTKNTKLQKHETQNTKAQYKNKYKHTKIYTCTLHLPGFMPYGKLVNLILIGFYRCSHSFTEGLSVPKFIPVTV